MDDAAINIRISPARQASLPAINALISRSKSYWSWPPEYLEQALRLLVLAPAYLEDNRCFEALDPQDRIVAFFALAEHDGKNVLGHLWVAPERIGHGIGRCACEHACTLGRELGWRELWVYPDPHAEGFYRKMGFSDTGMRVPSRVPQGPVFSVYRIPL